MSRPELTLAREFEAALAWWQAAGVTHDFVDDATAWLADAPLDAPLGQPQPRPGQAQTAPRAGEPQPRRAGTPSPPQSEPDAASRPSLLGDSPPADLAAFHRFWMETPGLAPATGFPRVPPRGAEGASLMVLVPQPEAEDSDRLLSGPQGRLLAAILAAMGLAEDEVYYAAALPCHTPMADLAALAAGGLDAVTAHHVTLARPQRILALGTGLAPLLGGQTDDALREINQSMRKTPVLVSETLGAMMDMPRLKARFWRRWMEWSPTI
jgi:DNA polymerase